MDMDQLGKKFNLKPTEILAKVGYKN